MTNTTEHFDKMWAALELQLEHTPGQSSEWLVSLKLVIGAVERAIQTDGRGAFIFLIPPSGGLQPQSGGGGAADPPQAGTPTPPPG
jgi:hypothetical protein